MSPNDQLDGLFRLLERRVIEFPLGIDGRESRRQQQRIALTQWDGEPFRETQQHLAAWH